MARSEVLCGWRGVTSCCGERSRSLVRETDPRREENVTVALDREKFKGTLPYSAELFGVYHPILGWKSGRTVSD